MDVELKPVVGESVSVRARGRVGRQETVVVCGRWRPRCTAVPPIEYKRRGGRVKFVQCYYNCAQM